MKVKQAIEKSGRFYEPDTKDLLMPEIVVCPECGSFIYPHKEDKLNSYYSPNMTKDHRYYTRHYAKATFTCPDCGCKFSRTVNTYTDFNWNTIKLDISKVLISLSTITLFSCAWVKDIIHNDIIILVVGALSFLICLVSIIYYWRNMK